MKESVFHGSLYVHDIKNREVPFEGDSLFIVNGRVYYSVFVVVDNGEHFDELVFDEVFLTHYEPKGSTLGNDGLTAGLDVVGLMRLEEATKKSLNKDERLKIALINKRK